MTGPEQPHDERGSVSIEMVLLLPALFTLILVGVQGALYYYASTIASGAAQDGARAASVDGPTGGLTSGRHAASSALEQSHAGLEDPQISAATETTGPRFTVTGSCPTLLPGLHLRVERSASLPWEKLS